MRRILMVLLAVLACAAPAAYAVDCDARISDGASLIETGEVAAAASRLSDTGADVRVVTVSSLEGQGNLDNLFRAYLSRCSSWQSGNAVKNNLIVFMVSVGERNSIGLFFNKTGPYAVLNHAWISIQTDVVKPAFKQRQWDSGLVAGLDQIARVTRQAAQVAPPVEVAPPVAQQPPVVVQTQPTDFSGLWTVLGFAVGAVIVGGIAWGLFWLISAAVSRKERRRSAQLRARNAKATCDAGITGFDSATENVSAQLDLLRGQLLPEDIGDLSKDLDRARSLIHSAGLEFIEVEHGVYDPNRPKLSEGEYVRIAEFFEGINTKIRAAKEAVGTCEDAISKKRALPVEAQTAEEAARIACVQAAEAINDAHNAGYLTDTPVKKLAGSMTGRAAAQKLRSSKQYTASIAASQKVAVSAKEATDWCTGLPARLSKFARDGGFAKARTATVLDSIAKGKEAFAALAADFNRSSYESIHGNGTEAMAELSRAKVLLLDGLSAAISVEEQRWDDADNALAEATAAMDRADALITAIHNRKKHLERVKADAVAEVEAARKDIVAATSYCADHQDDVAAGHAEALNLATRQLNEVYDKLAEKWPDWPHIAKLAKAANEAADVILTKARSEHEAAERKRQQAATNMREAKRARAKLREYEKNHHSKVSDGVRRRLDEVDRRLEEAERSSDLALIIAVTQSVANDANSAYESARHDVSAATPVYTPSSSYHSDHSVGGGSSSFDFGSSSSSDSVGGGSTDF